MFWLKLLRLVPQPIMCLLVYLFKKKLIERAMKTPYFDLPNYMRRWHLFQNVHFLGHTWSARIHCTLRSDLDRHLHDHPYDNASVVLEGSLWEEVPHPKYDPIGGTRFRASHFRMPGDVVVRKANAPHRLILNEPVWTLFLILKEHKRRWGFWTEEGWVYWKNYVDVTTLATEELAELNNAEPSA